MALSLVSQLLFPHVCVWTYSLFAWLQRLESASHPDLLTVVRSASSGVFLIIFDVKVATSSETDGMAPP